MRARVLLAIQTALLGEVPASLRSVTCRWTDEEVTFRSIFDGPIDKDDEESMRCVGTEVVANFPAPMMIEEEIVRLDYHESLLPQMVQPWAYMRKEKVTKIVSSNLERRP